MSKRANAVPRVIPAEPQAKVEQELFEARRDYMREQLAMAPARALLDRMAQTRDEMTPPTG